MVGTGIWISYHIILYPAAERTRAGHAEAKLFWKWLIVRKPHAAIHPSGQLSKFIANGSGQTGLFRNQVTSWIRDPKADSKHVFIAEGYSLAAGVANCSSADRPMSMVCGFTALGNPPGSNSFGSEAFAYRKVVGLN